MPVRPPGSSGKTETEWLSGCGLSCQALMYCRDGVNLAFLARNYLQSYQHLRFLRI